jgi:hypothetical protein
MPKREWQSLLHFLHLTKNSLFNIALLFFFIQRCGCSCVQEFGEIEEASQLARKILLCKTANDATEKLYYSVPFGNKASKTKEVKGV